MMLRRGALDIIEVAITMLSLNSYGLPRITGSNNNQYEGGRVTLPRLNVGSPHARTSAALSPFSPAPPRETRSLSKVEMMRRAEHPLYRTTTGYEYGRHVEIPDSALSVPKHARHADFTQDFIAGPFKDNSLMSIDKSVMRAESWQRKVEQRTKQMKIKYDEMQEKLEVKKQERRREREARRREQHAQNQAAVIIQAHIRGFVVRSRLHRERYVQQTAAAGRIQQVFRSREQVKQAKRELNAMRRERLDGYATKLQLACRRFVLRQNAMRQLEALRQEHKQAIRKGSEGIPCGRLQHLTNEEAAFTIQRAMRQHLGRRVQRTHSIRSNTSTSTSSETKDGEAVLSAGGSNSARAKQSQRLARRTIVSLKQRKREKSAHRLL